MASPCWRCWEVGVKLLGVPAIILPAPSAILLRLVSSTPTLAADFLQTIRGVLAGYAIGSGAGLLVAILVDRSPFLQRGLLPLGNFVSALPIVGVAPIMVMWFGFDWQSKAAVVDVQAVAFGDLFLEDVRAYRETRLTAAGKRGLFPLWGHDTGVLAREFVAAGFQASIVCLDPRALDASFAGPSV